MPIVSQGNSVVVDVGAYDGLWVKSTGSAEVIVNQTYAGTPEVINVTTETVRVGFYGEPVTVSIRAVSGNADYQDTPDKIYPLTSVQGGQRADSSPLDIAQTVNQLASFIGNSSISVSAFDYLVTSKPNPIDKSTWDYLPAIDAALAAAASVGGSVVFDGSYGVSGTVRVPPNLHMNFDSGYVYPLAGFSGLSVIKFGDESQDVSGRWYGSASSVRVDLKASSVYGVDFARPWGTAEIGFVEVLNAKKRAVIVRSGWGLQVMSMRLSAVIAEGPYGINADNDSIGFETLTSDCYFGPSDISYFFNAVKASGGNNIFDGMHPFGMYTLTASGQQRSCQLGIPFWNLGQGNVFINCIADSPSMVNYAGTVSTTNGGYAFLNTSNGNKARFIGCSVICPNRTSFGESGPVAKVEPYRANQSADYIGCMINDEMGVTVGDFTGTNIATCQISGIQRNQFYSSSQPVFARKAFMNKGIEFMAKYQDPDERTATWGACSFNMPSRAWFDIITNHDGDQRTIKLPRWSNGTTTNRTTVAGFLTAGDAGYFFYDTTLSLPLWWNGTAFRKADGTAP